MKKEILILVDKNDKKIGEAERGECHGIKARLHRAFLILVFNKRGQLYVQKRSKFKKLWPGFWDGSVASHVYPGESYNKATKRRLKQELGISCPLKMAFKFNYFAKYKDTRSEPSRTIGAEKEVCSIFIGKYNKDIKPNKKEAARGKFIDLEEVILDTKKNPEKYTPWFLITLRKLKKK
jgi:isopentenyl-diphosphate delta-isomerase